MFHDNDSQRVVNLEYQLDKKELAFMITKTELAFMITKTLFIRCYTIKYDISLDTLQHNIMHYIIALTNHSIFQSYFKRTN